MLDRLKRLFRYGHWANQETLAAASTPRALALAAHVLGTEWLWLSRLRERPTPAAVWPDWDAARCAYEAAVLAGEWERFLDAEGEAGLARGIDYVNSKGEGWTSTVEDMLMHVVLHGSYHRGQAAASVRESGGEPAYTDFIHAVRTGKIQ
jgi:uncharacterized damage-inducible protein DinB